jgi:drug/metabolite transporter (DMT)-like permease
MADTNTRTLGSTDVMMLLAVLFWGVNLTVIKIAVRHLSPHAFNSIRLSGSALLLFAFLALRRESLALPWTDLWKIAVLGILGNFAYQTLFISGFRHTTASNASLILATSPIFIALISSAFKIERVTPAGWFGIALSFVGLYLVISQQAGGFHLSGSGLRGDLMILGGNIFWAAYTVFSKPLLERMSPLKFSTLTLAAGSIVYLLFALPELGRLDWQAVPASSWLALAGSGFFAIAVGYVFWYTSVKIVGSARTAVYNNFTPVLAIVFAAFFLGERITAGQVAGAAVILAGVYLTRTGDRFFIKNKVVSHVPE